MWADHDPPASRRLLLAAVDSFAELGYHGTTTRQIAATAGMSPAALYVHYRTKGDLLFQIALTAHESVVATLHAAMDPRAARPARIRAMVYAFTRWHARHHRAARVIQQHELAALPADHRERVYALRRETARMFLDEVSAGVAAGEFDVPDPAGTTRALTSLGIDVARWYDPAGARSPEEIAALYAHLALRMLGVRPAG
ncbi:TetR family transcriptional regulator [Actinomadura craniellae]|uniref:TetR family transcriptional regulator n=1 Tax=Actinomadura craniellae TaxID=2231787 RepID=A0A365HEE6_9ACTN|nr:TetR family transcriptional regulator [Actinomadura craniellae]